MVEKYDEKVLRKLLREIEISEYSIKHVAKYMILFQQDFHREIFIIWSKYYQIDSNKCGDMIKYLYLMYEVTLRNFNNYKQYYIKLFGDNIKKISEDYVLKAKNYDDFNSLIYLLNSWYNSGIFGSFIIYEILNPIKTYIKENRFSNNYSEISDKDIEDYNHIINSPFLSKVLVSEINSEAIKDNYYSFVKRLNFLIDQNYKKFRNKDIKEYIKNKLLYLKEHLLEDISLNQILSKEILENLL